jgi:hypothetical protein
MLQFFKQIICLVLVSVILLQTFNKTIILTDYHINKEYISKVLCVNKSKPKMHCNGKCHLKKELSKAEKKEQSPANPLNEKNEIQLFSEPNSVFDLFNIVSLNSNNKLISGYSFHLSDKHPDSIFHPPQV